MDLSQIRPFVRFSRFLSLKNDTSMPSRIPRDYRLFYTVSGNSKILCDDTFYSMSPDSVLIIPAGCEYKLIAPENEVTYISLNFDYTFNFSHKSSPIPPHVANKNTRISLIEKIDFTNPKCLNEPLFCAEIPQIENSLMKIDMEYTNNLLYSENLISAYLLQVITHCVREALLHSSNSDSAHQKTNKIIKYVQSHFDENITNSQLAKVFNLHPNYISNLMKQHTGMSLHKYLLHTRIRHAIHLLETSDLSITEIATQIGFYDSSYFTKYFKAVTGKIPSAYKK